MASILAYGILGAIAVSAFIFIDKTLGKAIDEIANDFADDPRPASLLAPASPFHGEGPTR